MAKDISVVICTLNAERMIVECLQSIKENSPLEIILVDGKSTDRTVELAEEYVDQVLYDEGKGLGAARNLGLEAVKGEYVISVGPDNVMPLGSLEGLKNFLIENGYSLVSPQTQLQDISSYLGWAQDQYKRRRIQGENTIVGTPMLGITRIMKEYEFDPEVIYADDTDLCERMRKDGHRFGIAPTICYEIGSSSLPYVFRRWKMYGDSDYNFYKKYAGGWNLWRKLRSFFHPFYTGIVDPVQKHGIFHSVPLLPFLLFVTTIRYYGWGRRLLTS